MNLYKLTTVRGNYAFVAARTSDDACKKLEAWMRDVDIDDMIKTIDIYGTSSGDLANDNSSNIALFLTIG